MAADDVAEEELVIDAGAVSRLISVLRMGVNDILTSAMKDFTTDGTKSKAKASRYVAWYAKYRAEVPGSARMVSDMSKTDSNTILSLLAQEWSSILPALLSESQISSRPCVI